MDKCTFQITVTPSNITALREALLHVGVAFDPIKDMMAPPHEPVLYGFLSGTELPELKAIADTYFEETNFPMRLIEDLTALPPSTRMALLQGFGLNAEWTTDQEPAPAFH